jgi:hypothetical protein
MSVGISMLALAVGTPTRAIGGQPGEGGPTPAEEATAFPQQRARVPAVVVPSVFNVEAAAATRFEISAGEHPEDLPLGTVVRISGLPKGTTLSGGQINTERGWVVPLWALNDLKIRAAPDASGDFRLIVALVDNNSAVLDERSVVLHINPRVPNVPQDLPPAAKTAAAAPTLVVPQVFNAEAAAATRFDARVGEHPEDLPPGTVIRVSGLPQRTTLSGGQANADRGWFVPLWALDDLKIRVAPDTSGDFPLIVALVGNNGATLAERNVLLHIKPEVTEVPREPAKTAVAGSSPIETPPKELPPNVNVGDRPTSSAGRSSVLSPSTASDKPTHRNDLKRSRVTDVRNTNSGPCLVEWRFYSQKVLWHVGGCSNGR